MWLHSCGATPGLAPTAAHSPNPSFFNQYLLFLLLPSVNLFWDFPEDQKACVKLDSKNLEKHGTWKNEEFELDVVFLRTPFGYFEHMENSWLNCKY